MLKVQKDKDVKEKADAEYKVYPGLFLSIID